MTFFDLCCGTGAVSLLLIRPDGVDSLPMMGSKARYAREILDLLGASRPDRLVMADHGPWGSWWQTVAADGLGFEVADAIEAMPRDGCELFEQLVDAPIPDCAVQRAAAFACLQVGNASGRAVRSNGSTWVTHGYGHVSGSGIARGFVERLRPSILAQKVRRIAACSWPAVHVVVDDLRGFDAALIVEGDVVYIDPPYAGTTGYDVEDLTDDEVVELALDCHRRGARVGVSEAREVDLSGWHAERLTSRHWTARRSRDEWITLSDAPRCARQIDMFGRAG